MGFTRLANCWRCSGAVVGWRGGHNPYPFIRPQCVDCHAYPEDKPEQKPFDEEGCRQALYAAILDSGEIVTTAGIEACVARQREIYLRTIGAKP